MRQASRIEDQPEPPTEPPASWAAELSTVEDEGVALSIEAMERFPHDTQQALHWLEHHYRLQPSDTERAIIAEAVQNVCASRSLDLSPDAEANRVLLAQRMGAAA